jgi:hypothetical protein
MARDPIEIIITLPDLDCRRSPWGGWEFRASGGDRSFRSALQGIPGRLVTVGREGGEQSFKSWTAIDSDEDLCEKLGDLLAWVALAELERGARGAASRVFLDRG